MSDDALSNTHAPSAMVPAEFAEKAMGSLMKLHTELVDEKDRRVELYRRLMEKEQALAELKMYVRLLEEKVQALEPLRAPAATAAPSKPVEAAPQPTPTPPAREPLHVVREPARPPVPAIRAVPRPPPPPANARPAKVTRLAPPAAPAATAASAQVRPAPPAPPARPTPPSPAASKTAPAVKPSRASDGWKAW